MRTYNEYINESLRDKMTPKSEEELKKSLGEKRYIEYKNLLEVQELLSKSPYGYSNLHKDADLMFLKVSTELDDFEIRYIDGKYNMSTTTRHHLVNTKEELMDVMKSTTLRSMDIYEREKMKEISHIQEEIKDMKDQIFHIKDNY